MKAYLDDIYRLEVAPSIDKIEEILKLDTAVKDKAQRIEAARTELAELKFGGLMCLSERKGLLLTKRGYGYGEDEEDEEM